MCDAATRIQATFRGHMARKEATGISIKTEEDLREITKKVSFRIQRLDLYNME